MKRSLSMAAITTAMVLAGCASTSTPETNEGFARLADHGCDKVGRELIVSGHVSRADDETLVIWDGQDRDRTVSVRLPARSTGDRIRGALGTSPHERGVRQLNALASENRPVRATLVCQGAGVPPSAIRLSYMDAGGVRTDITF